MRARGEPYLRAPWLWGDAGGLGSEESEDSDDLLEVLGALPSFILQSKSCFLKSLGELGLVDSGISLASEEPEAGVDRSCPLVTLCLWSDGVSPCPTKHAQCLLVSPSLYLPLPPPSVNFTSSWFLSNLP